MGLLGFIELRRHSAVAEAMAAGLEVVVTPTVRASPPPLFPVWTPPQGGSAGGGRWYESGRAEEEERKVMPPTSEQIGRNKQDREAHHRTLMRVPPEEGLRLRRSCWRKTGVFTAAAASITNGRWRWVGERRKPRELRSPW